DTQSLQDVAGALSAVPGLNAVVDSASGTMRVLALPGFAFDFAGDTSTGANPDTAGILSALGLNSLFTGTIPGGLDVRSELLQDPSQLALSTTGAAGDGSNLSRLLAT